MAEKYDRLRPGDTGYDLVQGCKRLGQWICDARGHDEPDGCPNPCCYKHPTTEKEEPING